MYVSASRTLKSCEVPPRPWRVSNGSDGKVDIRQHSNQSTGVEGDGRAEQREQMVTGRRTCRTSGGRREERGTRVRRGRTHDHKARVEVGEEEGGYAAPNKSDEDALKGPAVRARADCKDIHSQRGDDEHCARSRGMGRVKSTQSPRRVCDSGEGDFKYTRVGSSGMLARSEWPQRGQGRK